MYNRLESPFQSGNGPPFAASSCLPRSQEFSNKTCNSLRPTRSFCVTLTLYATKKLSDSRINSPFNQMRANVSKPSKHKSIRLEISATSNSSLYSQSVSPTHCTSNSFMPKNGSGIRPCDIKSVCAVPGTWAVRQPSPAKSVSGFSFGLRCLNDQPECKSVRVFGWSMRTPCR